jgi:hypothetical protein
MSMLRDMPVIRRDMPATEKVPYAAFLNGEEIVDWREELATAGVSHSDDELVKRLDVQLQKMVGSHRYPFQ